MHFEQEVGSDMEEQTIVISMSPDVIALLNDNEVDLLQELKRQKPDVKRVPWPDVLEPAAPGLKSVELVILAAAGAAPIIASAVVKIIDAIGRNKQASITPTIPILKASAIEQEEQKTSATSSHSLKISFMGFKIELIDKYGR